MSKCFNLSSFLSRTLSLCLCLSFGSGEKHTDSLIDLWQAFDSGVEWRWGTDGLGMKRYSLKTYDKLVKSICFGLKSGLTCKTLCCIGMDVLMDYLGGLVWLWSRRMWCLLEIWATFNVSRYLTSVQSISSPYSVSLVAFDGHWRWRLNSRYRRSCVSYSKVTFKVP